MSKHTQGPWRAMGTEVTDGKGHVFRLCDPRYCDLTYAECEANARLIAEAPAMAKLLRTVNELAPSDEWYAERDALLARIEGGTE